MKRILSTLIAVLMLFSCFGIVASAEEAEKVYPDGLENVALKGLAYCSTMKNSNWTPPSSINNGLDYTGDWHGWEPKYPTILPGQDTSAGFKGEYCGIKFLNREYYEIHEIRMSVGLHALYNQDVTYTIQALVEGEWQDVCVLKDSQATNIKLDTGDADGDGDKTDYVYSSYAEAMEKDTSNYHIGAELKFVLPTPITTNNVRVNVSDFGKGYPGGDVLIFPFIYEVELVGKLGVTPDIDLPEGAVFSQNAAYNSIPYASSSKSLGYPYRAIDGKTTTAWTPSSLEAGQNLMLVFDKEYTIDKLSLNFGELKQGATPVNHPFKLEALVDGAWVSVANGGSYNTEANTYLTEYSITPVKTNQVRVVFEQALASAPSIYEFEANIVGERSYYLDNRFTASQMGSSAKGNLAILGQAYASANILPYSDPSYINDGKYFADSPVWFPGSLTVPVSCGVKLDQAYNINKVVVYCAEPDEIGYGVTRFNIVAKIDGEYKVVATGDAYNPDKMIEGIQTRYATIYEFPEGINTDDIRVEFIRSSSTIPNVLELELYSSTEKCSMFDGYPTQDKIPVYVDVKAEEQTPPEGDQPSTDTPSGDNTPAPQEPKEDNTVAIIIGVSLCFVAAAIAVASIFIVIKYKKKTDDGTAKENDEDNSSNEK